PYLTSQVPKCPQSIPGPKHPQSIPAPKCPQSIPSPKCPQSIPSPKFPQSNPGPKCPQNSIASPKHPQSNPGPKCPLSNPGPKCPQTCEKACYKNANIRRLRKILKNQGDTHPLHAVLVHLGDGAVLVPAHPHPPCWQLRRPHVWFQLCG
uniref:Uncharacterized protein n=1 Tax=Geospiza parvula TaxID=87175 RepID=A0A8U8BTW9_GEOPR